MSRRNVRIHPPGRGDETHHALYPTSTVDAVFERSEKQIATNPNPLFVNSEPTAVTVVEP